MIGKDNNLNLLRFAAASLVTFSHSYPLSGNPVEPLYPWGPSFGYVAVDIFFVISGLLITQSFLKADIGFFIYRRIIRIYPALIVANIFCVFIVGLSQTSLSIGEYLSNSQIYNFLFYNSVLILGPIHYSLPGVFESNPYPTAVNGSLWTLPWEIRMYALLAILGMFSFTPVKLIKERYLPKVIVLIAALSTALYIISYLSTPTEMHYAIRFTSLFFLGGAFFVCRHRVLLHHDVAISCLVILAVSLLNLKLFCICYCLVAPLLTLYIAYVPAGRIRLFNQLGDYSYGLYIYAFPMQQLVAKFTDNVSMLKMFTLSWFLTLALAIVSWHFVEKTVLKRKADYHSLKRQSTKIMNRFIHAAKR